MNEITKIKESPDIDCEKVCKGVEVPSGEEVEALDAMRKIKEQVRIIKKKISNLSDTMGNEEERSNMEKEIADLKTKWKEWDLKRKEAARTRMILLGHEEA